MKPYCGSPQVKNLPARAFASQRFYWPTKCCSMVLTIGMLSSLRWPQDGIHSRGNTWPRREDEYVRDLGLHGSATETRAEKEVEERESAFKEILK